jgi:DivIVA domain-containing protein
MALTPEDVVNKRFQPTKFREGYDQDEVDDFLDEVVVELRRLNQENEELRQRMIGGEARINELQRSGAAQAALPQSASPQSAFVDQSQFGAPVAAAVAPPAPAPVAYPAPVDANGVDPSNTNNLLQLARKLHEEHVREGIEKRDALIAEGHAAAAKVVNDAEAAQRQQLSALDQERQSIENRIEDLRNFEREYRQKLKSYIESQLQELESPNAMTNASQDSSQSAPEQPEQPQAAQQPESVQALQSQPVPVQAGQQYGEQPAQQGAPFDPIQSASQPSGYQGFGGN